MDPINFLGVEVDLNVFYVIGFCCVILIFAITFAIANASFSKHNEALNEKANATKQRAAKNNELTNKLTEGTEIVKETAKSLMPKQDGTGDLIKKLNEEKSR